MQPLLQNLVEMTAHRDHLRLEISVLSTLFKLNGGKNWRVTNEGLNLGEGI
jgi:hypothetical protein